MDAAADDGDVLGGYSGGHEFSLSEVVNVVAAFCCVRFACGRMRARLGERVDVFDDPEDLERLWPGQQAAGPCPCRAAGELRIEPGIGARARRERGRWCRRLPEAPKTPGDRCRSRDPTVSCRRRGRVPGCPGPTSCTPLRSRGRGSGGPPGLPCRSSTAWTGPRSRGAGTRKPLCRRRPGPGRGSQFGGRSGRCPRAARQAGGRPDRRSGVVGGDGAPAAGCRIRPGRWCSPDRSADGFAVEDRLARRPCAESNAWRCRRSGA